MLSISKFLISIIEKKYNIQNFATSDEIENQLAEIDRSIKILVNKKEGDKNILELFNFYKKYMNLQEELVLRKRLDSGSITLLYLIYSISGGLVGLGFSISVYFTTVGTIGHLLLIFSMLGGIIAVILGSVSIRKERDYLLFLLNHKQ